MINRSETIRYLGYKGDEVDENTLRLIEECEGLLKKSANPRSTYQVFDLKKIDDETLDLGVFKIKSKALSRNLRGCKKVILFAATLGPRVDILLQKYSKLSQVKAVVLQASAASMIEVYIDSIEDKIRLEAKEKGLYLRPRFSPGYADLSLEYQRDIFKILDLPRRIGATLMDNLIMAPSKTVTAFIGLSEEDRNVCDYE